MTSEPGARPLLPVACTLGADDGAERLSQWRQVASVAAVGRRLVPGKLTLRFRNVATVGVELERLVTAERDCCSYLGWRLVRVNDEWHVEITGADADLEALQME